MSEEVPATNKRLRTRGEAAAYVTERYFPCAVTTLHRLACRGGGPPFRKSGRWALYEDVDLDLWAKGEISPKVNTASELKAGAAAPKQEAA